MHWLPQTHFDRVFPSVDDEDALLRQMAVARILVGLVALWRTGLLAIGQFYLEGGWQAAPAESSHLWLYPVVECVLLLGLTLGWMTPLFLVGLLTTYLHMDYRLRTFTLGTDVLTMLLILLLLCNCGQRFSLDSLFASRLRSKRARTCLAWAMNVKFARSPGDYRLALWLTFLAYALTHFGAMLWHFDDPYWRNGSTVAVMLTNSYLCRWYELFRSLESWNPQLYTAMSAMAVVTQGVFQLAMIALVGFRVGHKFVVWYGWVFIALSLLALQLSYLPHMEVCLWWLLFHRLRPKPGTGGLSDRERPERVSIGMRRIGAVYGLVLLLFVGTFAHIDQWLDDRGLDWRRPTAICKYVGLCVPVVFNRTDLKMGDSWFLLYRVTEKGNARVPLNGSDGRRLWMHSSDALYFGTSLRWRRGVIDRVPAEYCAVDQPGFALIRRAALVDHHRHRVAESQTYRVDVIASRSSCIDIHDLPARYQGRLVHAFEFDIGGKQPCEPRIVDLGVTEAEPIRQSSRSVGRRR